MPDGVLAPDSPAPERGGVTASLVGVAAVFAVAELKPSSLSLMLAAVLPSREIPDRLPRIIVRPQPGNPERGFEAGSEAGSEADVQAKHPSVVKLPRLAARRKDLNGDMRDWSETGSSEMTVDMRHSVVRSQMTSSYVGTSGAFPSTMFSRDGPDVRSSCRARRNIPRHEYRQEKMNLDTEK